MPHLGRRLGIRIDRMLASRHYGHVGVGGAFEIQSGPFRQRENKREEHEDPATECSVLGLRETAEQGVARADEREFTSRVASLWDESRFHEQLPAALEEGEEGFAVISAGRMDGFFN